MAPHGDVEAEGAEAKAPSREKGSIKTQETLGGNAGAPYCTVHTITTAIKAKVPCKSIYLPHS